MSASERGRMGEAYTAMRLEALGYQIHQRNFRTRLGEIDLIAQRGEILAFVEVKTRGPRSLGEASQAVDRRKRTRIVRTAECYLLEHPCPLQPRFDVAEVYLRSSNGFEVVNYHYIEGAFTVDETA